MGEIRLLQEALQRAREAAMAEVPFRQERKLWQFQKWRGDGGGTPVSARGSSGGSGVSKATNIAATSKPAHASAGSF